MRRRMPQREDLMERLSPVLVPVLGIVVLGIAAIVFGEADDAPGLVMLGLLLIVAGITFGVSPAMRTKSRILGLLIGAVVLTAIGAGIAGWLENTF